MKTKTLLKTLFLLAFTAVAHAQNCPATATTSISSNPNTYYPGVDANLAAGATTINLGAASGSTAIASGDLLLLIQMQGAQINSTNTSSYGDGVAGGYANGYLNNASLRAGNMEYVVATNTVALSGGALTLFSGTVNSYRNAAYSTDGQYRYQVIRVGLYYNLKLTASITANNWNGKTGGILVISVTNTLDFNGKTLSAAATGFRGGAARQLSGGSGGVSTDVVTTSAQNFNGSKAEGIAGTPRFIANHGVILDNGSSNEGYPAGSFAQGAPGNAGGGGTDGNPGSNDQNSGGGGGANGGSGGKGGNSWSSNLPSGGEPGAAFAQKSPSRLVMGGGGGAGTTNNGTGSFSAGFATSGASGGGIVLLTANAIINSGTIDVSGENAYTTVLNDGSGGGGAGGSALVFAGSGLSNVTVLAKGGVGGTNTGTGSPHGPGGGGGGGVIYSNATLNAASSAAPGIAGTTSLGSNYNAQAGTIGILVENVTRAQVPNQFLYCSLLPVKFTGITAVWEQRNVVVRWEASNEEAVKTYTVERSYDGVTYTAIGVVASNIHVYTDTKNYNSGVTYYRIKETDQADDILYSPVASVRGQQNNETLLTVSPNPAVNATASIQFKSNVAAGTTVNLRMVSMNGITVWKKAVTATIGINTIQVEHLESIANGTYFIQYTDSQLLMNTKLVVQH